MKIVVTGSDGQLGSEFKHISKQHPEFTFIFTNRSALDITDSGSVEQFLEINKPDILINCAAYTAVDKAEEETRSAKKINIKGPATLAKYCNEYNAVLIHYSSDYIYHNEGPKPLEEHDEVNPSSVYAQTKLSGEKEVIANSPRSLIIRTSWVYSSFGNNFVKTMLRLGQERDSLTIVNDQIGTPTYARDLALATLELVPQIMHPNFNDFGVFNYSNSGQTNWMDFAKKIFELENLKCKVHPTTTEKYGAPANRPLWSVLSKEKIKSIFGLNIPTWETSLMKCLHELKYIQH